MAYRYKAEPAELGSPSIKQKTSLIFIISIQIKNMTNLEML
jgi:hypothetical protein